MLISINNQIEIHDKIKIEGSILCSKIILDLTELTTISYLLYPMSNNMQPIPIQNPIGYYSFSF